MSMPDDGSTPQYPNRREEISPRLFFLSFPLVSAPHSVPSPAIVSWIPSSYLLSWREIILLPLRFLLELCPRRVFSFFLCFPCVSYFLFFLHPPFSLGTLFSRISGDKPYCTPPLFPCDFTAFPFCYYGLLFPPFFSSDLSYFSASDPTLFFSVSAMMLRG